MIPYDTLSAILWNLCYALVILIAGNLLASWLQGMAASFLGRSRLDPMVRRLLVSLVRPVVLAIAIFAALQKLGIPISTFAAMLGAITLAVGMSLQGSLSNVASGTILLTLRPFNVGDVITSGGHTGTVQSLQLFSTTLHTPDGQTVTLPNDIVWKSALVNFSDRPTRRIRLTYTLPADTSLDDAEAAITEALASDERFHAEPAPGILYGDPSDLGIVVFITAHVDNSDFGSAKSALLRRVSSNLADKGIHIATRAR